MNSVSINIPEEDLTEINNAIATLKAKLSPYLIAITPAERQAVPKMSDGTIPFVEKAMDYAREDAQFLPPTLIWMKSIKIGMRLRTWSQCLGISSK
tara:strand:- start:521 stop:808 length:288 start_codon:yes stop_codon:yes gene_type:complete